MLNDSPVYRGLAQEAEQAISALNGLFNPLLIITSCNMPDYDARLNDASSNYENENHDLSLWLHVEFNDEESTIYYKTKSNLSVAEAEAEIDALYSESIKGYNSTESANLEQNNSSRNSFQSGSYNCNDSS